MTDNVLVEHWRKANLDAPPYLHPDDDVPPEDRETDISSYKDFWFKAWREEQSVKGRLHLNLLPQPYLGDLANAKIFILLLNPGLSAADYFLEYEVPGFRDQLRACILQDRRDFLFLDPKLAWTSGFAWWERRLRSVARRIAGEKRYGDYEQALRCLSTRIAAVELVPYHSLAFGRYGRLASRSKAREFILSLGPDRTVIVLRGAKDWQLPEKDNLIIQPPEYARSASLGECTPGGKAILAAYGIRVA